MEKPSLKLLNLHGANNVRDREIHTTESIVPESSASEAEMATEKLKRHKSPSIDQVPAEVIKVHSEIHKLINSIWKGGIA